MAPVSRSIAMPPAVVQGLQKQAPASIGNRGPDATPAISAAEQGAEAVAAMQQAALALLQAATSPGPASWASPVFNNLERSF